MEGLKTALMDEFQTCFECRVVENIEKSRCEVAAVLEKNKIEVKSVQDCVDRVAEVMGRSQGDVSTLVQVREQLLEDKEEELEKHKRRASIIVHGLKESSSSEAEQRYKDDCDQLQEILHHMACDDVSVQQVVRLGKRSSQVDAAPKTFKGYVAIGGAEGKDFA